MARSLSFQKRKNTVLYKYKNFLSRKLKRKLANYFIKLRIAYNN